MCPRRARAFSPSEGERERSAVPAGFPQKAREVPNPGTGDFRPGRAGAFCRLRRRENCCRAAAGVCKRGYRTPLKTWFPIPPLATPPDLPVCRDSRWSRGQDAGTAMKTTLSSGAVRRRLGLACLRRRASFRAYQCAAAGAVSCVCCDFIFAAEFFVAV